MDTAIPDRPESCSFRFDGASLRAVRRADKGLSPVHPVHLKSFVHGLPDPAGFDLNALPYPAPAGVPTDLTAYPMDVVAHAHEFCEVAVVLHGHATHVTGRARVPAGANTAHFVPPGPAHAFENCSSWHVTVVSYLAEWLLEDLRGLGRESGALSMFLAPGVFFGPDGGSAVQWPMRQEETAAVVAELEALHRENTKPDASPLFLKGCLYKALVVFAEAATRAGLMPAPPVHPYQRQIDQAVEAIERAVLSGEPVRVDALAARAGMSVSHFNRRFRESLGRGPKAFYQTRRVQHAGRLLLDPAYTVTEVGQLLGFATSAHFSNVFRKYRGLSPRAYRQRFAEHGPGAW